VRPGQQTCFKKKMKRCNPKNHGKFGEEEEQLKEIGPKPAKAGSSWDDQDTRRPTKERTGGFQKERGRMGEARKPDRQSKENRFSQPEARFWDEDPKRGQKEKQTRWENYRIRDQNASRNRKGPSGEKHEGGPLFVIRKKREEINRKMAKKKCPLNVEEEEKQSVE